MVPRDVEHRPVAEEEAHVLLFETASTLNTGNVQNERTVTRAGICRSEGLGSQGSTSRFSGLDRRERDLVRVVGGVDPVDRAVFLQVSGLRSPWTNGGPRVERGRSPVHAPYAVRPRPRPRHLSSTSRRLLSTGVHRSWGRTGSTHCPQRRPQGELSTGLFTVGG